MLKIYTLPLGAYQANCYIVHEASSGTCCVIDPGAHPEIILSRLSELGMTADAILLTHGHFDHVGAVRELAAETGCRVYLCEADLSLPPVITAGPLYYTDLYGEGDVLHLAGLTFSILHTPGHTPGSVCILTEDTMFTGDTLFAGSCGRTDMPGGSQDDMRQSLARLSGLSTDYIICPGHGCRTTLGEEKKSNPYL